MSMTAAALLDEAKRLPVEERAMVAEKLLETLDPDTESDVEAAWAAEVGRRAEEAERDPGVLVDWAGAKAEIEKELKRR
jgi:putative addiction module component (TIGR02574 family)